jgi:transcriptional antiterminator NusG
MSEEVGAKHWYAVHTYSGYENKVKKKFRETCRIYEYD